MRLLAPAKINLHLRVGPLDQASGFHPLMSWFCTVALFDTLTIEHADVPGISLQCDEPGVPCDATNLVVRAAAALQAAALQAAALRRETNPAKQLGLRILLEKRIQAGGGLGGGSSDAARALLGLNRMWHLNHSVDHLSGIAAKLGSDVPFFLHGPSSVCTSRGEIVRPIEKPRPGWVLLILPGFAVSTPAVYRKFDEMGLGDRGSTTAQPDWQQWADLSAGPLLSRLVNDLEPPAFALCPELAELHAMAQNLLGQIVRMSGSGSSLFTLFDKQPEAILAAARIQDYCGVQTLITQLAPAIDDDLRM